LTDSALKPRWDIFCKIVDNFGDIGVCWRLARQLHVEHGLQVRLWIDDLGVAQAIIPSLNIEKVVQVCDEINILKWNAETDFSQASDVVIETFACGLPPAYLVAMGQQKSKWVNLEYLSAELWVDDFHGKPSPQVLLNSGNDLVRHFYFPGFTEATGGLIREKNILSRYSDFSQSDNNVIKVSLFYYHYAPIQPLLTSLAESNQAINCYVSDNSIFSQLADFFDKDLINVGDTLTKGNLTLHALPFLSQAGYDQLLQACDVNFVRGEDSWIRAIWAGKPFIWQPYLQTENTHIKKLKAFIDVFYANYEQKDMLWKAHEYWATDHVMQAEFNVDWQQYFNALESINAFTQTQANALVKQTDLAAKLVFFCNKL
jgi:uncharacterized repeat protein (TIGR03837 family)